MDSAGNVPNREPLPAPIKKMLQKLAQSRNNVLMLNNLNLIVVLVSVLLMGALTV